MRGAVAVMTLALAMLLPAVAQAEVRSATLQDARGDGDPDVLSAAVSYDTGGGVEARVTFASLPASGTNTLALVFLGEFLGSTCEESLRLAAFADAPGDGSVFQRTDGTDSVAGPARIEGATLVMSGASAALAEDIDCAYVAVGPGGEVSDTIRAQELLGPAAPPPPPDPPDPPDPPEQPDPVPPKPKATPLERYDAAVAKCKKRKKCVKRAAKKNRKGAALARKRRTNRFIGKAFLSVDVDVAGVCGGSCISGWIFSDDKWVHRGVPEDGPAVARCKKVTAKGDKDGCLRYRLSKNRKTAIVGKTKLRLKGDDLIDASKPKAPYSRVAIPKTGGRFDAALDNISSFGIPGVNQSFFTSQLYLDRDGRFTTASQATGTNGQGSDFENSYTVLGADKKGHYAFEPGGTLALFFEDGRVTRRSALVAFGEKDTLGTVSRDGLLLDGSVYLPEDD